MHSRTKRSLVAVGCTLLVAYAGICAWMKLNEHRLVFHANLKMTPARQSLELDPEWLEIGRAGELPLHAWLIRSRPADSAAQLWVLYFHGNGSNVTTWWNQREYHKLRELGFSILAAEYPGFGRAPGAPSEEILRAQARAARDYLQKTVGVADRNIVIWGESLGTGIAVDLASSASAGALVLIAPFASLVKSAAGRYPFLPVSLLAADRFESDAKMSSIRMPVLITHTLEDEVIPYAEGRTLYQLAREPKRFEAGHGPHAFHGHEFYLALREFLAAAAGLELHMPREPIGATIAAVLEQQGSEAALARYRELKAQQPHAYNFAEYELEDLGYDLLASKRNADAISIMQLNREAFPHSFEPYDSLGEAYLRSGNVEAAAENFRHSIEVYPAADNYSRPKLDELSATRGH